MLGAIAADAFLLFRYQKPIELDRTSDEILSLGEENKISIDLSNTTTQTLALEVIDYVPYQFQNRSFSEKKVLKRGEVGRLHYFLKPLKRGDYIFNGTHVFIHTLSLGLCERKLSFSDTMRLKTFPSIIQMRKVQLLTNSKISIESGIKKYRRLGHSYEFEQIRKYASGDDYRSINWKATGRRGDLMINQYEDERAQSIYFILDRGRSMKMPFDGLSLLDHSINATLSIANIANLKGDKIGCVSFDKSISTLIPVANSKRQIPLLINKLYNLELSEMESDFNRLYFHTRNNIKQRGLFFIFTNCNTKHSLDRIKDALIQMNKKHLVVVIMFKNTELEAFSKKPPKSIEAIYEQVISEKFGYEQDLIRTELQSVGIQAIVTDPSQLTTSVLNAYLQFKSTSRIG
jgi:uncharacterized protein (DUF58 family)